MVTKYSFFASSEEIDSLLQALMFVHECDRYPRSLRISARSWRLKLTNSKLASEL